MIEKTIASYGGPYADAETVEDPETQISAAYDNRALEDTALLTRTSFRAIVQFEGSITTPTVHFSRTSFGSGTETPTVTRVATGHFRITFAASYTDGAGDSETLDFKDGFVTVVGQGLGYRGAIVTPYVVDAFTFNTPWTASDLAGQRITVWIR